VPKAKQAHWLAITTHLSERLRMDVTAESSSEEDEEDQPTNSNNKGVTPSPPKRNVNFTEKKICSQGQEFTIKYPSSHELHHGNNISRWKRDSEILGNIRKKIQ